MSRLGYSVDFRECVLAYLSRGHSIKSASDIFKVSGRTINHWRKSVKENGHCNPQTSKRRASRKIDDAGLLEYIDKNPDALLEEIAQHFSCSSPSVWQRLKILKITRKKNHTLRGTR
jgi:transposase